MPYRPQSVYPDPPEGWVEEDFVYYFDSTNTPALGGIMASGQGINKLVLQLQDDAPFKLRGIQISGNTQSMQIRFYDAHDRELSQCLVEADRAYSGTENGAAPIGRLPVIVEPEVLCPAGGFLMLDISVL